MGNGSIKISMFLPLTASDEIPFQNSRCFPSQNLLLPSTHFIEHLLKKKNPSTVIFFSFPGRQGITIKPSKEKHACQRETLQSPIITEEEAPTGSPSSRLTLQSQAACLYIEPLGGALWLEEDSLWMDGLVCGGERGWESGNSEKDRPTGRRCDQDVKTMEWPKLRWHSAYIGFLKFSSLDIIMIIKAHLCSWGDFEYCGVPIGKWWWLRSFYVQPDIFCTFV